MGRTLNIKFLVILVTTSLLLVGGLYFLYGIQSRRVLDALLSKAEQAQSQGHPNLAATIYARYLRKKPDDYIVLARYGAVLDDMAQSTEAKGRVLRVLLKVLDDQPRNDVRRRVARLALDTGQWSAARQQLQKLIEIHPDDGDLESMLGRCEAAHGYSEKAEDWFTKAVQHQPHQTANYVQLAALLQERRGQTERVAALLDTLVAANQDSSSAFLARRVFTTNKQHSTRRMRTSRVPKG